MGTYLPGRPEGEGEESPGQRGLGLKLGVGSPEICLLWGWLEHGAHSRSMKKGLEQLGLSLEGAMEPGRV